jgi:predicted  nucleic acid-binding Zn-ribbon protein
MCFYFKEKFFMENIQINIELQEKISTLNQEMKILKQELLDSENEVRKLMLLRGYGIDELNDKELSQLENELKQILQRVKLERQKRTRSNTVEE